MQLTEGFQLTAELKCTLGAAEIIPFSVYDHLGDLVTTYSVTLVNSLLQDLQKLVS